ncbi:MAG: cytidylate kinase-like family protein, partial [Desulfobacterales bacterium]
MAVITISRQYGAGGKTLGKMVADELGYEFADSEIIAKVAEMANVSTHWVQTVENEAGGKLSRFVSRMVSRPLVDKILKGERGYIDETIYLDYLVLIIAQIADEGDVVILGRGSQYILDDHPDAFHVLMIDAFENRVRFMQKNYEMSERRATRLVRGEDKRRKTLYQKLGKTDYDNPFL